MQDVWVRFPIAPPFAISAVQRACNERASQSPRLRVYDSLLISPQVRGMQMTLLRVLQILFRARTLTVLFLQVRVGARKDPRPRLWQGSHSGS
jgi:hypothetical protein